MAAADIGKCVGASRATVYCHLSTRGPPPL
ncbi:hypothetical protein ABIB27_003872 [Arthrobacter sp. UYEF21]